jgi:hypothetical protein
MAEINANIVVEPINLAVIQDTTNIGVTVDSTDINIFTTVAMASGSPTEVLYNDNGKIAGIPITTFDGNNLTLGDSSNVKLNGGLNGYFLQTDGTGNLTWNAGVSAAGNGIPGGANSQFQYNDGTGNFAGAVGFTYDSGNGKVIVDTISVDTQLTNLGTTTIQQAKEKVTTHANSVSTYDYNVLNQAIVLQTVDASDNTILNIRGNATTTLNTFMSVNESLTLTWINKNGSVNAYILSDVKIDGVSRTVQWVQPSGQPTIGTFNGSDSYTLTIIKTASNTYTIFGTRVSYQ